MTLVCILDYGSGNVKSVFNLFSSVTDRVMISNDQNDIRDASHLVLPGVGSFGAAMGKIADRIPVELVRSEVQDGAKPFLGICVGMQVLADTGHEFGEHRGLGWIPGTVRKLEPGSLPLPHVGWNNVKSQAEHPLLSGLQDDPDFYFVHSYVFQPKRPGDVLATTEFGENFCAVIQHGPVLGVQFHPEKSQRAGVRLARNFLGIA